MFQLSKFTKQRTKGSKALGCLILVEISLIEKVSFALFLFFNFSPWNSDHYLEFNLDIAAYKKILAAVDDRDMLHNMYILVL